MKRLCLILLAAAFGSLLPACSTASMDGGGDPLDSAERSTGAQYSGMRGEAGVNAATAF